MPCMLVDQRVVGYGVPGTGVGYRVWGTGPCTGYGVLVPVPGIRAIIPGLGLLYPVLGLLYPD